MPFFLINIQLPCAKLFTSPFVPRLKNLDEIYETQKNAYAITESLGIPITGDLTNLEFPLRNKQEQATAQELLDGIGDHIVIAPFSAGANKDWPLDYYQDLINQLHKNITITIVVVGAKKQESEQLVNVINLTGRTTIMESAEIISRAKLFIGGCCANLHIASAVKTPAIGLYGPTSIKRWAPKHTTEIIENLPPCSPCFMKKVACNKNICMTTISVESVLDASLKYLR